MTNIYRIAEISYGYSDWDCSYDFEYQGIPFQVQRFGANYSSKLVKSLIAKFRKDVDAFSLVSLPPTPILGNKSYIHKHYFDIMNTPSSVPLCDGTGLKETLNIHSLIQKIERNEFDLSGGFYFLSAIFNSEVEEYLRHLPGVRVGFGDLYSVFGLPISLTPFPGMMKLTKLGLQLASVKEIKNQSNSLLGPIQGFGKEVLRNQLKDYRYIVADLSLVSYLGDHADLVQGKEVIISSHHEGIENRIKKMGATKIHNIFPDNFKLSPYMNYATLEAVFRLAHKKTAGLSFDEWQDFLDIPGPERPLIRRYSMRRKTSFQEKISKSFFQTKDRWFKEPSPDFAFVVHALSHHDFEKTPILGDAIQWLPEKWSDPFDQMMGKLPPILYGRVNHVISESTGREVNGLIYALFSTPKVLKSQDPEIAYQQIQKCCEDAASRGAKIIGLGAYTKVVGDSGVTINKNSPLPVTTGNSLSASATLWGLFEVVKKLNLQQLDPERNIILGTAMVIGATGSIGKVSAKLLSLVYKKLILVAPKMNRLQELKSELISISPKCEIICSTDANEWIKEVDALVTATSAFDQKIVDVMQLKSGCVVCDCSRPLDFTAEDAQKRPDVIIMESGELLLPGSYKLTCDLGLPGRTVYACLAETILLSLEERYESFTLGRNIDYLKVKEIYKLARRHGVKLAHIQGHMGTLTDREIQLTRELVLSRRT